MRTARRAHLLHTDPNSHGCLTLNSAYQISHTLPPLQDWKAEMDPRAGR